jgi:hypothetical protein
MKAYWKSEGIAPHILDLSTIWKRPASHPEDLPPGKEPLVPNGLETECTPEPV